MSSLSERVSHTAYVALKEKSKPQRSVPTKNLEWTHPPIGWTKLNVGTWLFHSESRTGFGFVHRDENGSLIATRASCRRGLLKSILGKLLAIHKALLCWTEQVRVEQIIVEADCPIAAGMVKRHSRLDEAGHLASFIITYLGRLRDVRIEVTSKQGNVGAVEAPQGATP